MAISEQLLNFIELASSARRYSECGFFVDYDKDADVVYVNFLKPSKATDSKLNGDILTRYLDDEVIGYTIMHASEHLRSARPRRGKVAARRVSPSSRARRKAK